MLRILDMVRDGWQFDTFYHDHAYVFRLTKGSITTMVSSKRISGNVHLAHVLGTLANNASYAASAISGRITRPSGTD